MFTFLLLCLFIFYGFFSVFCVFSCGSVTLLGVDFDHHFIHSHRIQNSQTLQIRQFELSFEEQTTADKLSPFFFFFFTV